MLSNIKRIIKKRLRRWRWRQWKYYRGNPVRMKTGAALYLNPHCDTSRSLYSKRYSQPEMINFFSRVIKRGATVIDVGANIGYMTTYFSNCVGNDGRVLAFECDSRAFFFLKKNLTLNRCTNTHPYLVALGDEAGTSRLYLSKNRTGNNMLYEPSRDRLDEPGQRSSKLVETTTLDNLLASNTFSNQTILKLDVEGIELKVLKGARNFFRLTEDLITVMEYTPTLILQTGALLEEFFEFCREEDLVVFRLSSTGTLVSLDRRSLEDLTQKLMSIPDNILHEDLFLVNSNSYFMNELFE